MRCVISSLSLVFVLVLAWAAPTRAAEQAQAEAGFVAMARGEAFIERGAERIVARIGQKVQVGDLLETGSKSRLKVLLSDDSVVALGSRSRLELKRHLFDKAGQRSTSFNLLRGQVRALVHKAVGGQRADFEVNTRTAVAGVRGTEFALSIDEQGRAGRLVTFSGSVIWTVGEAEPVMVAAGEACGLEDEGKPVALAAADLKAIRLETDAEQAPTALAWNLPVDKLGPGGPGEAPPGADDERDGPRSGSSAFSLGAGAPPTGDRDLEDGADQGLNSFFGDGGTLDGNGDLELSGSWAQDGQAGAVGLRLQVSLKRR